MGVGGNGPIWSLKLLPHQILRFYDKSQTPALLRKSSWARRRGRGRGDGLSPPKLPSTVTTRHPQPQPLTLPPPRALTAAGPCPCRGPAGPAAALTQPGAPHGSALGCRGRSRTRRRRKKKRRMRRRPGAPQGHGRAWRGLAR